MNNTQPRDGAFVVVFSGSLERWQEMKFLLGHSINDDLFELLGGGFDISDVTPDIAACREVFEETNGTLEVTPQELTYFCHMVQKIPRLGEKEKGHVFFFFKENGGIEKFESSHEHHILSWHTLQEILDFGEKKYRISTLRGIIRCLNYLLYPSFQFGILKDKVSFKNYEF